MPLKHNQLLVKYECQSPSKQTAICLVGKQHLLQESLPEVSEHLLQTQCAFSCTETHTLEDHQIPTLIAPDVLVNFKQFVLFLRNNSKLNIQIVGASKDSSLQNTDGIFYMLSSIFLCCKIDTAKTFIGMKMLSVDAYTTDAHAACPCSLLVYAAPLPLQQYIDTTQVQHASMGVFVSQNECYTHVAEDIEIAFYMRFSELLGIYDTLNTIMIKLRARLEDTVAPEVKLKDTMLSFTKDGAHTKIDFVDYEKQLSDLANLLSAVYNCVHCFTNKDIQSSKTTAVYFYALSLNSLKESKWLNTPRYYITFTELLDRLSVDISTGRTHSLALPHDLQVDYYTRFNIAFNSIIGTTRDCVRLTFAFNHRFLQEYCKYISVSEKHAIYAQMAMLVHNQCNICDPICAPTCHIDNDVLSQKRQHALQVAKNMQDYVYTVNTDSMHEVTLVCNPNVTQCDRDYIVANILHELKGILTSRMFYKVYIKRAMLMETRATQVSEQELINPEAHATDTGSSTDSKKPPTQSTALTVRRRRMGSRIIRRTQKVCNIM